MSLGKLMKQAARMQQQMETVQAQLAARTVEATSGGVITVGTAVAAFVGFASAGPVNQPTLCTNWSQFTSS